MSMVLPRGAENTCHSRAQSPPTSVVKNHSCRRMTTKAVCGVGEADTVVVVVVVDGAVAHFAHVVDVMQAGCPPGPMAQVETAPLARQLPVCVALGLPVSVGRSVGIVPTFTGSVKSGGFPVGLG